MIEIGDFQLLSEKLFTQYNSSLVTSLVGCLFTYDSLLGHVGHIFAL